MRTFEKRPGAQTPGLLNSRDGLFHIGPIGVLCKYGPNDHLKRAVGGPPMLRTKMGVKPAENTVYPAPYAGWVDHLSSKGLMP